MAKFVFDKIQRGSWGQASVGTVTIEADSKEVAEHLASRHKVCRRLRNGDTISLSYVGKVADSRPRNKPA